MKTTIKARVLATNEVVRVYQAKEGDMHFIDENNNPYRCEELDFNVEEEPTDPMMKIMEAFKPLPLPKIPTQDEINESNLKFEKEKFKMEKEKMRLQFMCDYTIKRGCDNMDFAEMIAKKIFDNDKG